MPQNQIIVIVPRGVSVVVVEEDSPADVSTSRIMRPEDVERYWREFLSDSGKKIFATAALIERHSGPGFTLDEIAANRNIDYESAKAWHRNAGRTAKRWREETGTEEPIRLQDTGQYGWRPEYSGDRTTYRLTPGIGETIIDLYTGG